MTDASYVPEFLGGAPADADIGPNGVLRITVGPKPLPVNGGSVGGSTGAKPYVPEFLGGPPSVSVANAPLQIGAGDAALSGFKQGATANFNDEISGVAAASGIQGDIGGISTMGMQLPIGAARLAYEHLTGQPGEATKAYNEAVDQIRQYQQQAQEQHPIASTVGQVGGTLVSAAALPMGAPAKGAGWLARAELGAASGGAYGAVSGAGAGTTPEDRFQQAISGGVVSAGLGGALGAAIRPVATQAPALSGPAATAVRLGAPLPKGIASNNRVVRGATSATASIPIFGARINNALDATRTAAGEAVGQSGVDEAIAANRGRINQLYDATRSQINPDKVMPMTRTAAAIKEVKGTRTAARQPNPSHGLEQFENIADQGASFNGAHRARVDAREAGDALNPHPGYNAADYNKIMRAMTQDIRANIKAQGGDSALNAFDKAERSFGPISAANKFLNRIARQRGAGAGLDELGFNPATGEFSLDKFITSWNKLNPEIRPFVPAPGQGQNIRDIFEMGSHIKSSMRERNTSHTSNVLILWDLARDAVMTGAAVGAGVVSGASVVASGLGATPAIALAHWLSSPAKAASMAAWSRAYRAFSNNPSPARIGGLTMATRNMANNLGLDPAKVFNSLQSHMQGTLSSSANETGQNQ